MIAKVIVDISLDREFDYLIPPELVQSVKIGSRVKIPFGRRHIAGFVVGFSDTSDFEKLKPIEGVVGTRPYIDDAVLKLARWMSAYYCASLECCFRSILPGAVRRKNSGFKQQDFVKLSGRELPVSLPAAQQKIAATLKEHPDGMLLTELLATTGTSRSPVNTLAKKGLVVITREDQIRDPLKNHKILPTSPLPLMPEQAAALQMIIGTPAPRPRTEDFQTRDFQTKDQGPGTKDTALPDRGLPDQGPGTKDQGQTTNERGQKTTASHGDALQQQPERNRCSAAPRAADLAGQYCGHSNFQTKDQGPGTKDQGQNTKDQGQTANRPILLYGVTGSGKTEVYLQAIAHELEHNRGAIVLVPEIALTPQTIRRFAARFGNRIAVLHSHLSEGERHDEWHRILSGKADVIIGARSAVFAPVKNLGLIVVDEEHEPSYKQSEAPRYNARDVAVMRAHICGCKVVLGSATPAIESWNNAKVGKYRLATLSKRADDRTMPTINIIDMRVEAARTGHPNVFSKELLDAIHSRLQRGEQTIIFLNRRGYSASLTCPKCGFVSECNQCSVSHTYHRSENRLICHICGDSIPVPLKCPECGDPEFRYAGLGTQRVESVIKKCFQHARVMRMDADTTRRKAAYDEILGDFRAGKIDILIGTQMIAKGLHFPNVTLVGVVYADLSLHIPDFRAGERTYQLLAQVAGRAGRGDVAGQVIVQTYTPHHSAIQAARRLDYEGLCEEEIAFRKELLYPPAAHLICINLKGKQEPEVKYCTELLATRLHKAITGNIIISDACPAPLAKAKGFYRYQIIMRGKTVSHMVNPLKQVVRDIKLPKGVSIAIDVDAMDIM